MKNASKLLAAALALAILTMASMTALAEYGSGAVSGGQTYTTEQMLTYAIQDEYMALAEYRAIIEKHGALRPFTSLIEAEQRHIDLLKPLFTAYGVAMPEDDTAGRVTAPETLTEAYEAGLKAETDNTAMYGAFLSQTLPDDVKAVFASLKAASENHLSTFERRISGQTGNAQGNRNGRGNGNVNGRGNAYNNGGNRGDYPNCSNCPYCPAA